MTDWKKRVSLPSKSVDFGPVANQKSRYQVQQTRTGGPNAETVKAVEDYLKGFFDEMGY